MAEQNTSYTQKLARAIDAAYSAYNANEPNSEGLLYRALLAQANNVVRYRLRSEAIFDTLAHDITERAMMALGSFHKRSKLSTWFYKIAQNEVNRALSGHIESRETHVSLDTQCPTGSTADSDDPPALREVARRLDRTNQAARQARLDIRRLMGGLPTAQAKVILLSMEGNTLEEIAKITGVPLGTIRSRYALAKKKIAVLTRKLP